MSEEHQFVVLAHGQIRGFESHLGLWREPPFGAFAVERPARCDTLAV